MALSDLHAAKTLSELNLSETADQIEALRKLDSNGAVVEEYLAILSAKMDNGDSMDALCSTQSFYEYVLYILLGIAEKSTALRSLINYIEEDERLNLQSLFDSLGRIISSDTFYFTQEMALEVLGRICFLLLSNQAKERVQDLVRPLSPLIKIHLTDKKSISVLLRDMRPLLNKVNESNVNIITFPVASVTLGNDSIAGSSWLDIAKAEMFCFFSEKLDIYFKFPLSSVISCEHTMPLHLEIKISEIPEMYKSVLPASSPQLMFRITFMDEEDVHDSIKYFKRSILLHAPKREEDTVSSLSSPEMFTEEQILRGQKISITRASKHETINKSMDSLLKLADTALNKSFLPKSPQAAARSSPKMTRSSVTSVRKAPAKSGRGRKRKAAMIRPVLMRNSAAIDNQPSLPENGGLPDKISFPEETMDVISPYRENKNSIANKSFTGVKRVYGEASKRKRNDETPSITASVLNARSAKMRSTDNTRKLSAKKPTLNMSKTFEMQGQENELNKILEKGRSANEDKANIRKKSVENPPEDIHHSFVYDFPSPHPFAEDEPPFEPHLPASTMKQQRDEDTTSRQSSSFLGKRKFGSANFTPRKLIPLVDTKIHSGPSFEEPKPPSWKKNENIISASKEPNTSIKSNRSNSSNAIVTTPIVVDNKTPFQQSKFASARDDARKRKPLREILGRNTPVPASIEQEDIQPIPKQSGVNHNFQQPSSHQQRKYPEDTEMKSKREKQREAMLTLSQQIEAMAPDLNDYVDEGNMGNVAVNNETVSATSFPDESSAALSRILQELQAFQKPSPKESTIGASKQRKQLRNIATSSQDQLRSYIHQVQHYVSFYLKDFDHSLRTNHDTLSYSLSVTVQPQILAQEMKSLTDFEQNTLSQYQDIFARFSALKNNVQDVRTQDREAALSFRKSLTQTRHACRSRAVTKLRNASSGVDTNNKNSNKRMPTAADLRSIVSGGRDIDIAALLRGSK